MKKLKIFTWHIHGSYLYYLTQANCDFYIPYNDGRTPGYAGKTPSFAWGENVHEIPVGDVKNEDFDVIVFQSNYPTHKEFLRDQYTLFSQKQLQLPKIFIEHDPPREHPTDTHHIVNDFSILLVHVTHFNKLMWDSGKTPSIVIEHGVKVPSHIEYTGKIDKGLVVINNLALRGRRLGLDIFEKVRKEVPLDLIGMGSKELGGLGEVPHTTLLEFVSQYRFFFNPIRYTSLGLSVAEAMMIGMPIVGLATTEMATTIQNDVNGFADTNLNTLIEKMHLLLKNPAYAQKLSIGAKITAQRKFSIDRFTKEWETVLQTVAMKKQIPNTIFQTL
jgi:glycosyltransferase involved in cell wall biosynthesis